MAATVATVAYLGLEARAVEVQVQLTAGLPRFTIVGMPAEMVAQMRRSDPAWGTLESLAPTLAYDSRVMGDISDGGAMPADLAGRVSAPTLVLVGGASPDWMIEVGRRLAEAVQSGEIRVLEGQEHVVPPELLAPVVREFLARR